MSTQESTVSTAEIKPEPIKLKEFLSYAGPFIIFLGVVRLTIFYSAFNISIIPYLDFSEIITSFLDILAIIVVQFIFGIVQAFLVEGKEERIEKRAIWLALRRESKFYKRLYVYLYMLRNVLVVFGCLVLGFVVWNYFFPPDPTWRWSSFFYVILSMLTYLIILYEINLKHDREKSSHTSRLLMTLLMWSIFTLGLVFSFAKSQANFILDDHSTLGTKIVLDDRELISDKQNYFIGKTQNFIFFYHEKDGRCDVFPMSRVKQIGLAPNPKKNTHK